MAYMKRKSGASILAALRPAPKPVAPFVGGRHKPVTSAYGSVKRRGVPAAIVQRVLERDGCACVGCGETEPRRLSVDHIIPVAFGGDNMIGNLQTLCRACNLDKKDSLSPAALRRMHPELRSEDLEYVGAYVTGRPGSDNRVKITDTVLAARIANPMRSVLVPEGLHAEVLAFVAKLRG